MKNGAELCGTLAGEYKPGTVRIVKGKLVIDSPAELVDGQTRRGGAIIASDTGGPEIGNKIAVVQIVEYVDERTSQMRFARLNDVRPVDKGLKQYCSDKPEDLWCRDVFESCKVFEFEKNVSKEKAKSGKLYAYNTIALALKKFAIISRKRDLGPDEVANMVDYVFSRVLSDANSLLRSSNVLNAFTTAVVGFILDNPKNWRGQLRQSLPKLNMNFENESWQGILFFPQDNGKNKILTGSVELTAAVKKIRSRLATA